MKYFEKFEEDDFDNNLIFSPKFGCNNPLTFAKENGFRHDKSYYIEPFFIQNICKIYIKSINVSKIEIPKNCSVNEAFEKMRSNDLECWK